MVPRPVACALVDRRNCVLGDTVRLRGDATGAAPDHPAGQ